MRKGIRGFAAAALLCLLLAGCGEKMAEVPQAEQVQNKETLNEEAQAESQEELTEEEEDTAETQMEQQEEKPTEPVKGIYVTGPMAGHANMEQLIGLVKDSELNAMVIDMKNDEGIVTYKMDEAMVQELGAAVNYIPDLPALTRRLKEEGVYLIARIVAFKDPLLAEKRPDLCIQRKDGGVFRDKNGLAWVNPYRQEVWEYLMDIAAEAVKAGFDEIQFDYIRFPTEITDEDADYGTESAEKSKTEIITEFTEYAYETLSPQGVKVSADVFGTVIDNETDAKIVGQDYRAMAEHLDYICPMIYPSHYRDGVYGIEHPDLQPYETISGALNASAEALGNQEAAADGAEDNGGLAQVRPWLQDFTAVWLSSHQSYGAEQLRQQIQAVYDTGGTEWLLWNAKCSYTEEGLLSEQKAASAQGNVPDMQTEE